MAWYICDGDAVSGCEDKILLPSTLRYFPITSRMLGVLLGKMMSAQKNGMDVVFGIRSTN